MCNLFEPYDITVPKGFNRFNDNGQIYINGDAHSEQYKLKYMTVADFEWNVNDYNADFSLWKALYTTIGNDAAKELLLFNDKYFEITELIKTIEREGKTDEVLTKAKRAMYELNSINASLQKILINKSLAAEISAFRDAQVNKFEKLISK